MTGLERTKERFPEDLWVPIADLKVEPGRGRKDFGHVPKLADSIRAFGLFHPCLVTEENGQRTLVAGECRFRAMTILGWSAVPCATEGSLSPVQRKEIELEENLSREALDWDEECELLAQLNELKQTEHGEKQRGPGDGGWGLEETAQITGQSASGVSVKIALAKELRKLSDDDPLKAKLVGLPMNAAAKELEAVQHAEKVGRLVESGAIKLRADIRHGDALDVLREMDSESVDLVLTDPPFGISEIEDRRDRQRTSSTQSYTGRIEAEDNLSHEDAAELLEKVIPEIARILKPGRHFYVFFKMDMIRVLLESMWDSGLEPEPVPLIWDKGRTTSAFRGYAYTPCYEPIVFGHKTPRTRRLRKPQKTILAYSPVESKDKIHRFEKPLKLLRFLVEQSSNVGEVVLDPFAGSGSTIVAAKELGRTGIGIEKSRRHFLEAQGRLVGEDIE